MSRLSDSLRQLLFPAEFRIAVPDPNAPPFVPLPEPLDEAAPEPEPAPAWPLVEQSDVDGELSDRVLADVATNLWRTRRKLDDDIEPTRAHRQAQLHLLAAWDRFAEAGLEIHDFEGTAFERDTALEVLGYEPRPDVHADTVLETVRPAVYRQGRRIQPGQVIVACPERGSHR